METCLAAQLTNAGRRQGTRRTWGYQGLTAAWMSELPTSFHTALGELEVGTAPAHLPMFCRWSPTAPFLGSSKRWTTIICNDL